MIFIIFVRNKANLIKNQFPDPILPAMKEESSPCCLKTISKSSFVLSCSGACDLGNIADHVARKLSREGYRKMHCLAVVGAGIDNHTRELKRSNLLVIDGCAKNCGKKIVEDAGFRDFYYLRISDLGFGKGKTGVTGRSINSVFKIASRLN